MGGGDQSSVQRTEPPSVAIPYIQGQPAKGNKPAIPGVLPEAAALYQSDKPSYYPGQTVADFTPAQLQAQQQGTALATASNPLADTSQGYLGDVIGGKYLGGQSLQPVSDALWGQVSNKVNSAAALAGRVGSGAHDAVLSREFTNALAPYAFNQYNTERGLQQQAALGAPSVTGGFLQQDLSKTGLLGDIGNQQQTQAQNLINADVNKWNFNQNVDQQKLDNYLRAVYGVPGSTSYSTTPGPSTGQQVLGGLLGLGGLTTGILGIPGIL